MSFLRSLILESLGTIIAPLKEPLKDPFKGTLYTPIEPWGTQGSPGPGAPTHHRNLYRRQRGQRHGQPARPKRVREKGCGCKV